MQWSHLLQPILNKFLDEDSVTFMKVEAIREPTHWQYWLGVIEVVGGVIKSSRGSKFGKIVGGSSKVVGGQNFQQKWNVGKILGKNGRRVKIL